MQYADQSRPSVYRLSPTAYRPLVSGTREGNRIHVNNHSDYAILIVEDEPDILSLLQEHFAEEGYKTLAATSGTEAIMQAKTKHPDVILLDVMMPGMSGFDVCNILRDFPETRTTPIIFLTAVAEMPRKIMGLRLGANDYVTKPFDLRELSARVEVALRNTVGSTQEAAGSDAGPTAVTRGS